MDAYSPFPIDGLAEAIDGKRAVGIHPPIALRKGAARSFKQSFRFSELGHQTVNCKLPALFRFDYSHFPSSVSCTNSRISKIEIIGRTRINRNNKQTNNPMLPIKMA